MLSYGSLFLFVIDMDQTSILYWSGKKPNSSHCLQLSHILFGIEFQCDFILTLCDCFPLRITESCFSNSRRDFTFSYSYSRGNAGSLAGGSLPSFSLCFTPFYSKIKKAAGNDCFWFKVFLQFLRWRLCIQSHQTCSVKTTFQTQFYPNTSDK